MPGARGRLLIIDDSEESSALLSEVVEEEGFDPVMCHTAEDGVKTFAAIHPVAVFVDWVLPDRPGIDVCREIRALDQVVPIIFVSGRDDETSMSRGLDAGADDFIVKPFRRGELVSRLDAHLRKATLAGAGAAARPAPGAKSHQFGEIEVDAAARVVRVDSEEIALGPLEFRLLDYFCNNAGIAVSREQILNEVYGYDADISTERVDLLVRRLRSKLGEGPARGGQLVAVPGYGYRLERRLSRASERA
jgi:DNA-binding response OmpR family regulator